MKPLTPAPSSRPGCAPRPSAAWGARAEDHPSPCRAAAKGSARSREIAIPWCSEGHHARPNHKHGPLLGDGVDRSGGRRATRAAAWRAELEQRASRPARAGPVQRHDSVRGAAVAAGAGTTRVDLAELRGCAMVALLIGCALSHRPAGPHCATRGPRRPGRGVTPHLCRPRPYRDQPGPTGSDLACGRPSRHAVRAIR